MMSLIIDKMRGSKLLLAVLLGIGSNAALAATTVLNFDSLPIGVDVGDQYLSLGVSATGAVATSASFTPWPANSGANIAYAPTGLMTFSMNPSIIGNVQSLSLYASSDADIGVYAYDSFGNLVAQSISTGPNVNTLFSVTSSGNPISSVSIHDGGSSFAIDTLSINSTPPPMTCKDVTTILYNGIAALPNSSFYKPTQAAKQRAELQKEVNTFSSLVNANASNSQLYSQLKEIRTKVNQWVAPGTDLNKLLGLINQLWNMTNQNQC